MNPVSNLLINETLGTWPESATPDCISLDLIETNTNLIYFTSEKPDNIKLFHRPAGFQLINAGILNSEKNFSLPFDAIKKIELFPEKLVVRRKPFNLLLIALVVFILLLNGFVSAEKNQPVVGFTCGVLLTVSLLAFVKLYSKHKTIKITTANEDYFIFLCRSNRSKSVEQFFTSTMGDSFIKH